MNDRAALEILKQNRVEVGDDTRPYSEIVAGLTEKGVITVAGGNCR